MVAEKPQARIDPRRLLLLLEPLYRHLRHHEPDDRELVAWLIYKALEKWEQQVPAEKKADLRRREKLNASAVMRSVPPEIRALLDRRGGDRSKTPKSLPKAA